MESLPSKDTLEKKLEEKMTLTDEDTSSKKLEPNLNIKRTGYLSWEDYFMGIAFLSAQRSKDPSSQVGACIVNPENKLVGIGYNGMPVGCSDDLLSWSRTGETFADTKYAYVCHAEMNAIINKISYDVTGCTIYVALFPCNECAKIVIQSRISEVVYYSDKYHDRPEMVASRKMFKLAGVSFRQYTPSRSQILIDFTTIDQHAPKPTGSKSYFKE